MFPEFVKTLQEYQYDKKLKVYVKGLEYAEKDITNGLVDRYLMVICGLIQNSKKEMESGLQRYFDLNCIFDIMTACIYNM